MNQKPATVTLPYAIMCELRQIAGDRPSIQFRPIGTRRPHPEVFLKRRPYFRPMSPVKSPEMERPYAVEPLESSASIQDLIDLGLIEHGFLQDNNEGKGLYGFSLTVKAVEALAADSRSRPDVDTQ